MKKELKQRWIEALLNGKYEQGDGHLRHNNKFCCLGVLCDIIDDTKWNSAYNGTPWTYTQPYRSGHETTEKSGTFTDAMSSKVGIHPSMVDKLTMLNDGGASFKELAEYIEKNVE